MKNKNFVIFKIDDRAKQNVLDIKNKLSDLEEIKFESFKANKDNVGGKLNDLKLFINDWKYTKVGEVGIWITKILFLNKMIEDDIKSSLCLEDDTILSDDFYQSFIQIESELPQEYDFLTMVYPKASQYMYKEDAIIEGKNICLAKYNYFNIQCLLWSKKGSKKFLDLVKKDGIGDPIDLCLYRYVKNKELNGFSVTPNFKKTVFHDLSQYGSTIDPSNSRGTLEV